MSQAELAEKLNKKYDTHVSKSMISRWESSKTDPKMGYVRIIADYFGADPNSMMDDSDDTQIVKNSIDGKILTPDFPQTFELNHNYNYFDTGLSAGILAEVDPFTSSDVQRVTLSDLIMGKYAGDPDVFVSKINGESMNRVIPNHSMIAIKKFQSIQELCDGDIVVFQDGGDMSVKRFYNDENSKIVTFNPDSSDSTFKPINYRYEDLDGVGIIGKVVVYTVEI